MLGICRAIVDRVRQERAGDLGSNRWRGYRAFVSVELELPNILSSRRQSNDHIQRSDDCSVHTWPERSVQTHAKIVDDLG